MGTVGTILNVCVAVTILPLAYAAEKTAASFAAELKLPVASEPQVSYFATAAISRCKTGGSLVVAKLILQMKGASILCIR